MLSAIKSWLIKHAIPIFNPVIFDQLAAVPITLPSHPIPATPWLYAEKDSPAFTLPQTIAHRGYRARYPENTLLALRAAVEQTRASGLETDLRLTKDGVVLLSHDDSLKRVFGEEKGDVKVSESSYSSLTHLRTAHEPGEPLGRMDELLKYLADSTTRPDIWVMLDIKLHGDMRRVMQHIAKTIDSVAPHPQRPWKDRLVLGIWSETCLPLCTEILPGFPVAYIGVSVDYAHRFLRSGEQYKNISLSMLTEAMVLRPNIISDVRHASRPILAWNIMKEDWLEWCIDSGLDGVITDDPKRFDDMKIAWANSRKDGTVSKHKGRRKKFSWSFHDLFIRTMITIFNTALRWRSEELGVRADGSSLRSNKR